MKKQARQSLPSLFATQDQHSIDAIFLCPWRWLIGISLLSALLTWVKLHTDWYSIFSYWQHVYLPHIALAFGLFSLSHLLRAYRIRLQLNPQQSASFWHIAKISAIHQTANNLLPMRMGELVLPFLMRRYFGQSWLSGVLKLLWLRLFDLLTMGTVVAITLAVIFPGWRLALIASNLGGLITIIGLIYLYQYKQAVCKRYLPVFAQKILQAIIDTAPPNIKLGSLLGLCTLASWSAKLGAIIIAIMAVTPITPAQALLGTLGTELGALLPVHGIAGAGTFEASFLAAVSLLASPNNQLLAAAINTHIFALATTCLMALLLSPIKISPYKQTSSFKPNLAKT